MQRKKIAIIALLAIVTATAGYGWAQVALVNHFRLKTRAVLTRAGAPTPAPIVFVGPGKAKADPNGVTIEFDVLTRRNGRGKASIRLNNPLNYTTRPNFRGRGAAWVRLPNRRFAFRILIKGTIKRTATGELLMHGKYTSVSSTVAGAKFEGRFGGISP